ALRLAVAEARARAEAMAAGAGRSLDRILKIEEGTGARPPIPLQRTMAMRADAVTTVEPGLIELEAEVTLTASMKCPPFALRKRRPASPPRASRLRVTKKRGAC